MREKLTLAYEVTLVTFALISVIVIWMDSPMLRFLDLVVWAFFFVDVSVRFVRAPDKWDYVKRNPFDLIAIIPFDALFQLARIARLMRVLRLISISKKYGARFFLVLRTNQLDKVIGVTIILILAGSVPVFYVEPGVETYADAVWWSIVTTTTVGYGDISPVTGVGRLIAVVLMFIGIGTLGMITGSVATFFIQDTAETDPTIRHIKDELKRHEELTAEEFDRLIVLIEQLKNEKTSP